MFLKNLNIKVKQVLMLALVVTLFLIIYFWSSITLYFLLGIFASTLFFGIAMIIIYSNDPNTIKISNAYSSYLSILSMLSFILILMSNSSGQNAYDFYEFLLGLYIGTFSFNTLYYILQPHKKILHNQIKNGEQRI